MSKQGSEALAGGSAAQRPNKPRAANDPSPRTRAPRPAVGDPSPQTRAQQAKYGGGKMTAAVRKVQAVN